ncbi:lactate utilization protein C [Metabacillus idriensis]|uniref:Lactate utilization protein C n=1 Tax=Metabacillus idriensis TaxID=324768 RepID=A0A6I2M948_9BACI|nr:lactate utilization protein C [Metabacillus idriensis]MCM3595785.1 lactate utilization protein C [Metabacillus idriensis]MRX53894.1 lactate utilization protein C [Metabacillus idriensis]OHR64604.1 lactate utilization protein C [Bacillus sp. HMSC76G11]
MIKGNIQYRDPFLETVASKLGRGRRKAVTKPNWSISPQWEVLKNADADELVEVLKKQCLLIHTQFIETTAAQLSDKMMHVFDEYEVKSAVIAKDNRFQEFGLDNEITKAWPIAGIHIHEWDPLLKEKNIEASERSDIGIIFSDMTLAESGTVVVFSDKNKGRSINLLPKTCLCIIPKSTIVPRLTQAAEHISRQIKKGSHLSSCVDFITGPSNSADIELNLIVGVHGPIKASYIVVQDK